MKSVRINLKSDRDTETWLLTYEKGSYSSSQIGKAIAHDLAIVPGSTHVCYAPGETVPEAGEGWETVADETVTTLKPAIFGFNDHACAQVALLRSGDRARVQILRAPKPKEAVLLRVKVGPGILFPARGFTRWDCGECHYSHFSDTPNPTKCANCSAVFTETRDL